MAKTFRGTVMAGVVGYYTNSDALTEVYQRIAYAERKPFTSGSGDNQADRLFIDAGKTLTATPESYELDALTDIYGDTISLAKVRFIIIESLTLTSGYILTLSGDWVTGTGMATGVYPGGVSMLVAPVDGIPVTGGSVDTLTLSPGANQVKYNLIIGGND